MTKPQRKRKFDFTHVENQNRACYTGFEAMSAELRTMAERISARGGAPIRAIENDDTLVNKISQLRATGRRDDHTPTILFVDPDDTSRHEFEDAFGGEFHVIALATADDAMKMLERHHVDVLVASDPTSGREVEQQRHPHVARMHIEKPWQHDRVVRLLRDVLAVS